METFGDWLEYCNNLDVTPFLEDLKTMKAFYSNLGNDIFKDAVSLPGVSMHTFLRGTLKRRDPPELNAPSAEAYEMLKAAVVGADKALLAEVFKLLGNSAYGKFN